MKALKNKCFLCLWRNANVGVNVAGFTDIGLCWYEFDRRDVLRDVEQKLARFFLGGEAELREAIYERMERTREGREALEAESSARANA